MTISKQISQQTFDDVVKENVDDFGMSQEEAIADAISQFEAQGVDLSNIIKSGTIADNPILVAIGKLKQAKENDDNSVEDLEQLIKSITSACSDAESREIAAAHEGMDAVLDLGLLKDGNQRSIQLACMNAVSALSKGCHRSQDRIMQNHIQCITDILIQAVSSGDNECIEAAVQTIRTGCRKSERNRVMFVEAGVTTPLVTIVRKAVNERNTMLARSSCTAVRILTFDDDMRADFGTAHVNAKRLVEDGGISALIEMLGSSDNDAVAVAASCATLARLVIKDEFCKDAVDLGALNMASHALGEYQTDKDVAIHACALIKALSGNDEVKTAVCSGPCMKNVLNVMAQHPTVATLQENGCGVIAAVTLRSPSNAELIINTAGGIDALLRAFDLHKENARVQRQACLAVRNCCVRSEEVKTKFLAAGFEVVIRRAVTMHPNRCGDVGHGALRDLGCANVEFKELWTGQLSTVITESPLEEEEGGMDD